MQVKAPNVFKPCFVLIDQPWIKGKKTKFNGIVIIISTLPFVVYLEHRWKCGFSMGNVIGVVVAQTGFLVTDVYVVYKMKFHIRYNSTIQLAVVLNFISSISSNPIEIDVINFNDDWNYETLPSNVPILSSEGKQHKLPPMINLQVSRFRESTSGNPCPSCKSGNDLNQLGNLIRIKIPCNVCISGVGVFQDDVRNGVPFDLLKTKFVSTCISLNMQNQIVCSGIFDMYAPEAIPVLNLTHLGAKEICKMILGESCEEVENPQHKWEITLPNIPKPEAKEVPLSKPGKPTLKVLQISDTHFDPDYLEGSISNCDIPLCCRADSSPSKKNGTIIPAGKWGAYSCDSPKVLIENMLQHIAEEHTDIDYIIWTGDLPPHDIWNQSKDESLIILKECVSQMQRAFPNTPILPALGNHEGIPAGSFAPPWIQHKDHSISWLYEEVNRQWKKWLPDTEENTILHGGFYSVLIRPGLRLISLNTNYCDRVNWWLLINGTDPANELKWFIHQLQESENKGEKVHVIGHIAPGLTDCLKSWSENYYAIVDRYENTIAAQFFGHQHADEFEVFYDNLNYTRPTSVAYIGPSVTPYSGQNPAYRIYYIDGEHSDTTWEVIDHETWTIDLRKANTEDQKGPEWFKLYSARATYEMPNLRPSEWNNLIYKMAQNSSLFQQFYKFCYRDSLARPKYGDEEKLQHLCNLKSGKSHDRLHLCHDLEMIIYNERSFYIDSKNNFTSGAHGTLFNKTNFNMVCYFILMFLHLYIFC